MAELNNIKDRLAQLKASSASAGEALKEAVEKSKKGTFETDPLNDLIYKPVKDASGNAQAILRFVPCLTTDTPFVKVFNHNINIDKARWLDEKCPTTIGGKCPICSDASDMWSSGVDSIKEQAKKRFKKTNYYANVIVISDPKTPENEYKNSGKVFLFKFGKQIMDLIEIEATEGVSAFDLYNGCNFRFRITKQGDFPDYKTSKFEGASALFNGDDDKLVELLEKTIDLSQFHSPEKYKSYEDLETKYYSVVGNKSTNTQVDYDKPTSTQTNSSSLDEEDEDINSLLEDFD